MASTLELSATWHHYKLPDGIGLGKRDTFPEAATHSINIVKVESPCRTGMYQIFHAQKYISSSIPSLATYPNLCALTGYRQSLEWSAWHKH